PIENAVLSEVEWGARLAEALRRNDPSLDLSRARLEQFGQQWFSGVEPNPAMREAALQLKAAGYRVGILTNNVVEWEPYWRELVGLDTVVDLVVDSSHERCRKPDARFFDIAARRAGLAPAQNLLIDDVAENIEAAAALGWQTLHFRGNPGALSALEALTGIPLRAPQEALAS
ncbi:HAD family phosphatase, partial [Pseudomonas sp.]|uniref:HAD family hydrolase n=2 Tax=Pseudomonas TaxID=286 RepID=UPI00290C614A